MEIREINNCLKYSTSDYNINVNREEERVKNSGQGVPTEKIISRYERSMNLLLSIIQLNVHF